MGTSVKLSKRECVCSHVASEHKDGEGCQVCSCRYYLLNVVKASRIRAPRKSESVYSIPTGVSQLCDSFRRWGRHWTVGWLVTSRQVDS